MSSIIVYGGPNGSSLRVHWMLHEVNETYETKRVDLSAGEHKKPEFLAINPAGQIPAIEIDGIQLAESMAIVQYLAETRKPELLGETPAIRAQATRWALWTMLNPQKSMLDLAMQVWRNSHDETVTVKTQETLAAQLPTLEAHLATSPFVASDEFTTGDLIAATSFMYAKVGGYDLSSYPNISAWLERCFSRPAFKEASTN